VEEGDLIPDDDWEYGLEWDLGNCAYYARYCGLPGADPNGICSFGCREEPGCITDEPDGGWPSQREPSNWIRTA
jgi:hypothetical protein